MAGLCNQMFHAALLVGVGLLGFPDSQNHGHGGTSPKRSGFCAEGPVGQTFSGCTFTGEGAGAPLLWTCLLYGVATLSNIQNVGELQRGYLGVNKGAACSLWDI